MSNTATSFRQNGKELTITRTKLEHQRRQIRKARERQVRRFQHGIHCNCLYCSFDVTYSRYYTIGGKRIESLLK